MGGKYAPLTEVLVAAANRGESVVRLSFTELAALVGGLPTSAYQRRGWWANGYLVQAKSWRGVGWRVRQVDLTGEWVAFVREPPHDDAGPAYHGQDAGQRADRSTHTHPGPGSRPSLVCREARPRTGRGA